LPNATAEFRDAPPFQAGFGRASAAGVRSIAAANPDATMPIEPLDAVVRRTIERAITQCDGNILKAAALQVSASTLYRRIRAWQADLA